MKTIKHITLNVKKEITKVLPKTLKRDLQDNEIICPTCKGLGVTKRNYSFGVVNKNNTFDFYNNPYISFCPNCYTGVVKVCEYCGKILPKGRLKCDCEKQKELDEEERSVKYQETINKAKEVDIKDLPKDIYFYDKQTDDYFSEIENFVDAYKDNDAYKNDEEMLDDLPLVLWVCDEVDMSMDASWIVESACEELHEDAMDNIADSDIEELQKLLDEWCSKQSGTRTLYPAYEKYIRVKKEWFK